MYGKLQFTWLSLVMSMIVYFCVVLDEILNLIESVSEGFPTYSFITIKGTHDLHFELLTVFGISLSCLLYDDFHSCLFLYSCMLRGGVSYV